MTFISFTEALSPGDAGFIDGCTTTITPTPNYAETNYDQCKAEIAVIEGEIDALQAQITAAEVCEATAIAEYNNLPNPENWKYNGRAV